MAYHRIVYAVAALAAFSILGLVRLAWGEPVTYRVGHFPNITHVQALVAHGLSRQGRGWFEEHLGPDVKIQWFVYNAGPSAMEALFANSIDLTYVGPSPAINAYAKARGDDIRIVAGAVEGGAALVVQPEFRPARPGRFPGQKARHPPARKHTGRGGALLARFWRFKDHLDGRRCAGDPNRESGSTRIVQKP